MFRPFGHPQYYKPISTATCCIIINLSSTNYLYINIKIRYARILSSLCFVMKYCVVECEIIVTLFGIHPDISISSHSSPKFCESNR